MKLKRVKAKKIGNISLRWGLVWLIVGCWILPVMLTVVISGVLAGQSTRRHVGDIVASSVQNATDHLRRDLDTAVNDAVSMSYIPIIRNAYSQYMEDGNRADLFNTSREFLSQQYYRSGQVLAAHLLFGQIGVQDKDYCYVFNPSHITPQRARQFYASPAMEKALAMQETLGTEIGFLYSEDQLYLVRNFSLRESHYIPYAMLVLELNQEALYEGVGKLPYLVGATLAIDDLTLPVLGQASPLPQMEAGAMETLLDGDSMSTIGASEGERYTLRYRITADIGPLMAEMNTPLLLVIAVALVCALLMCVVLFFFMRRINRPISALSALAERIQQGQLGAQTDSAALGSQEFCYLGEQMNAMSARLEDQFERLYREELALRDARIKALQSQIDPHFLGNTLETINWEARLSGNVKVSQMLEALSTILRATQDRTHRPLVHLSEEMMYVNAYLYIIKERLGKRLQVTLNIDEGLLDWYVPRLILQPIVENAVVHGINARQRGHIVIQALPLDEQWMRLEVLNDGLMRPEDEARVRRLLAEDAAPEGADNIGIRNVHLRLRMLYGGQSGLVVQNNQNGQTVSSMCIQNKTDAQDNAT